jgi:arylsulfatase A-like enzyme
MNKRSIDGIKSFVEQAHSKDGKEPPFFSFTFLNHETHEYLTLSDSYDRNVRDLIDNLERDDYLNNTMFILMSDHGQRLTGIFYCKTGKFIKLKKSIYKITFKI